TPPESPRPAISTEPPRTVSAADGFGVIVASCASVTRRTRRFGARRSHSARVRERSPSSRAIRAIGAPALRRSRAMATASCRNAVGYRVAVRALRFSKLPACRRSRAASSIPHLPFERPSFDRPQASAQDGERRGVTLIVRLGGAAADDGDLVQQLLGFLNREEDSSELTE